MRQATISVSGRGLIALPAEMRKAAGIRPQDSLIAETTPEGILLRPALTLLIEIYTPERTAEFDAAEPATILTGTNRNFRMAFPPHRRSGCASILWP